jgi:hypothetical protein
MFRRIATAFLLSCSRPISVLFPSCVFVFTSDVVRISINLASFIYRRLASGTPAFDQNVHVQSCVPLRPHLQTLREF